MPFFCFICSRWVPSVTTEWRCSICNSWFVDSRGEATSAMVPLQNSPFRWNRSAVESRSRVTTIAQRPPAPTTRAFGAFQQLRRPTMYVDPNTGFIVPGGDENRQNPPTAREVKRRIESLLIRRFDARNDDNTCSICLEEQAETVATPGCRHVFHEACMKRWMEQKDTCPLCGICASRC